MPTPTERRQPLLTPNDDPAPKRSVDPNARAIGHVPIHRSFRSHRPFGRPQTIPWDGYCPNTLEELEELGYPVGCSPR
jgi:hypothetical protein